MTPAMNTNESSDPSLLAKQFALWREAIALANAEKIARRRFAKKIGGAINQHRVLLESSRSMRTAEYSRSKVEEPEPPGIQVAKTAGTGWKSPFLSFFRHTQRQPSAGLITATQK
jgi:hypothetical protein